MRISQTMKQCPILNETPSYENLEGLEVNFVKNEVWKNVSHVFRSSDFKPLKLQGMVLIP